MTQISLVVAMNQDNIIGVNNQLPWHLPEDLAHFKEVTLGKPIIMGRKTFESIGRVLPGRKNIVISRNPDFQIPGVSIYKSLESAISDNQDVPELCIIGGGEIFKQALPLSHKLYLTIVNYVIKNLDLKSNMVVHFPTLNLDEWHKIDSKSLVSSNGIACDFQTYSKISS